MDESTPRPHQPYVPDDAQVREFTWPALLLGAVLGIVFGASSLYLVLKVGMTISASVPVAVLSITLFRLFSRLFKVRRATILENNIVQTTGSAGESIAFGIGVTMPAAMLLGFDMSVGRTLMVAVLGGVLGILMMIPLRRAFIVKQHGRLKYPEGTACADVLIVGEQGGSNARTVFLGFGVAAAFQFARMGMKLFQETVSHPLRWFKGATPALDVDPALLGVGYIIGTKTACIMAAGGVLAYLMIAPAIHFFGDGLSAALYPGAKLIRQMSDSELRDNYILYIGAGAVAAGGIISLFQALPLIAGALFTGLGDLGGEIRGRRASSATPRTERDISMGKVFVGTLLLLLAVWVCLPLGSLFSLANLVAAVLIVVFGFLFVTVSSRLTGEIGSSSNPISGMTVATLLLTCLIFLVLGWTDPGHRLMALSVGAIVCVAASNGGTTSQDLKTGFLVGATPRFQQWAILVGSVSSALVIGLVLVALNQASTVYTQRDLPTIILAGEDLAGAKQETAPGDETVYHVWQATEGNKYAVPQGKYLVDAQGKIRYLVDPGINGRVNRRDNGIEVVKYTAPKARLMALITDGILNQKLPWTLVLLGVCLAIVLELSGVPSLPFAVGVYLPLATSTPILLGGLVRYAVDHWGRQPEGKRSEAEAEMSPGALLATGLIAGGAVAGVVVGFLSFSERTAESFAQWQYGRYAIVRTCSVDDAVRETSAARLGYDARTASPDQQAEIAQLADEIRQINAPALEGQTSLPAGTTLAVPQHTWPAMVWFSLLVVLLLLFGGGWHARRSSGGTAKSSGGTAGLSSSAES